MENTPTYKKPVIHLNLKKKWFDMILSGEKTEEYREVKEYYNKRFKPHSHVHIGTTWWPCHMINICFSCGYSKTRPQMIIEMKGMKFNSTGKYEWGAEPGKQYYVLELGPILETRNI